MWIGILEYRTRCLNWKAHDEGRQKFSVTVVFEDVELPEILGITQQASSKVTVHREYNKSDETETLNILVNDTPLEDLWSTPDYEEQQVAFINEYLIPIQAAKFVFFDAEKIAEIAEMNLRQQSRIMSDALSKILGLDIYEALFADLKTVQEELKKESASGHILREIESNENKKIIIQKKLEAVENEQDDLDEKLAELKKKISTLDDFLAKQGGQTVKVDIQGLRQQQAELEKQKESVSKKFLEVEELIPFSIAAGKLQEVVEQLQDQQELNKVLTLKEEAEEKQQNFLEKLFNHPPYPEGKDLNLKHKWFYYEKAGKLFDEIWRGQSSEEPLEYELDLNKSDTEHIFYIYDLAQRTSEDVYDKIFGDFQKIIRELNEIETQIQKAESEMEDDMLEEYRVKRETAEIERDKLVLKAGALESNRFRLEEDKEKLEGKIANLLDKVKASETKKAQIDSLIRYKNVLSEFIEKQKKVKSESLGQRISEELSRLMHKKDFVGRADVAVLPESGLIVELYDKDNQKLPPESLSQGEQQLYISCLLKAILGESITELPAFIDSPLARLDEEHKDNILRYYYPNLASQVVIFALNSEISTHKLKEIQHRVAQTYLLRNDGNVSAIKEGYF